MHRLENQAPEIGVEFARSTQPADVGVLAAFLSAASGLASLPGMVTTLVPEAIGTTLA